MGKVFQRFSRETSCDVEAMSDVTFFPKKTTLQDAIEKASEDLEHKLLQQGSGRIKLARAEAYMLSNR
jgi:hypothetical protein